MSLQVVVAVLSTLAVAALAAPSNLPSYHAPVHPAPSYHAPAHPTPSYHAPRPSYHAPAQYADVAPHYNAQYAVKDDYSGNDFGAQEARDGYSTQGSYHVLLPDGRLQRVTYHVDGDSGYVAEVTAIIMNQILIAWEDGAAAPGDGRDKDRLPSTARPSALHSRSSLQAALWGIFILSKQ
ncbi:hypothetical protein O3P69_014682 [Scylla paramamosain]|uniref:Cuticle protein n=1 Tax=Scylla paramamosain TaxID=85552 RepID=A0AAW0TYE8_SCYPA